MKRWLVGLLLVVLAGLLLVSVINSNRDPIAVLEEFGAKNEKVNAVRTIERNEKGEVVEVNLDSASISPLSQRLLFEIFRIGWPERSLSDAELVHLKGLTKLESLSLNGTVITDAGLVHLKGLTNLQTLDLSGTAITDAGLVHLKGLTKLQTLNLYGTKITDAGLVHLKGMTKLQWLYLMDTKVTDAGVADLQKSLSNCKIYNK
jgi:Leucine-rich repeat (LRR) protein